MFAVLAHAAFSKAAMLNEISAAQINYGPAMNWQTPRPHCAA
jgi:hypothetical protein